jgi:hypothetical protein
MWGSGCRVVLQNTNNWSKVGVKCLALFRLNKKWLNVKIRYGSDRNRKITDLELVSIYSNDKLILTSKPYARY